MKKSSSCHVDSVSRRLVCSYVAYTMMGHDVDGTTVSSRSPRRALSAPSVAVPSSLEQSF
ncbi:hypothetical protein Plhal304r1_c021g0075331 [Plasmopara halstedii]